MGGTALLTTRLIWEMTLLSWQYGPQMVGFSLAHGGGVILLVFPLALTVWLFIALVYLGYRFWKTRRIKPSALQAVLTSIGLLVLLSLPQGFWLRLFIDRSSKGPYAMEFFVDAAAMGDLATVKAFVKNGISVDAQEPREMKTALYGAAVQGQTEVIAYLIAHGANVNLLTSSGDSPLEAATSEHHDEAARYLASHGGKLIRGSDELHAKVVQAIVAEDIAKMDARRHQPTPPPHKP